MPEDLIVPFEETIARTYQIGFISDEGITIPITLTYNSQTPLFISGHGGDRRYDESTREETVSFGRLPRILDGHAFFEARYHRFTQPDGTHIRKRTRGIPHSDEHRLDRAQYGESFDATTWEDNVRKIFDKLPQEVRDVFDL